METKVQKVIGSLEAEKSAQSLLARPDVTSKFVSMYNTIHGSKNGAMIYEAEKFHFMKILEENPKLKECSKTSLYGILIDTAISGLSFDPAMKHQYLVPRGNKAVRMVDGRGELVMRVNQKQIKYADNPVLVFEGDVFSFGTANGLGFINHTVNLSNRNPGAKPIACYIKITRNDDSVDHKVLTVDELESIRKFSDSQNSPAWTKGYNGMFMNKCMKHAFRSYPKPRLGNFSQLETQVEEPATEINYDLVDEETGEVIHSDEVVNSNGPEKTVVTIEVQQAPGNTPENTEDTY